MTWISIEDRLPKMGKEATTGTVLVKHSDRPDYPLTAHAKLHNSEYGSLGIKIPTNGASDYKYINWHFLVGDGNNPFKLKGRDYSCFLPKVFGGKITHWMEIPK